MLPLALFIEAPLTRLAPSALATLSPLRGARVEQPARAVPTFAKGLSVRLPGLVGA